MMMIITPPGKKWTRSPDVYYTNKASAHIKHMVYMVMNARIMRLSSFVSFTSVVAILRITPCNSIAPAAAAEYDFSYYMK
jgi:hypothetical protein